MKAVSTILRDGKINVLVDADIGDLVEGFLARKDKDVIELRDALKRNDHETVEILGHRMKGAGEAFGFEEVSEIGKYLELAAKNWRSEEVRRLVEELSRYLESIQVTYR